jgi:hypothetical protein
MDQEIITKAGMSLDGPNRLVCRCGQFVGPDKRMQGHVNAAL